MDIVKVAIKAAGAPPAGSPSASGARLRGVVGAATLALGAATCSLAGLDDYDRGGTPTGGSSSSSSSSGAGGSLDDGGFEAAPPDASCAVAAGECVASAPVGWSGPFAYYEGAQGTEPACPAGFTVALDAHQGLTPASPAMCSKCTCGPVQGLSCPATATLHLYTDAACTSPCTAPVVSAGGCGPTLNSGCSNAVAFTMDGPSSVGSCTPAGGGTTLPPLQWLTAVRGCMPALAVRDCASGSTCAAMPPAPFASKLCIAQNGDLPCPGGVYTQKHSGTASANDTRACTPCACGQATATCGNFALNPGGDCFGPFYFQDAPLPISCHPAPSGGMYSFSYDNTPNPGASCPASGGQAVGSALPQGPITICCAM